MRFRNLKPIYRGLLIVCVSKLLFRRWCVDQGVQMLIVCHRPVVRSEAKSATADDVDFHLDQK